VTMSMDCLLTKRMNELSMINVAMDLCRAIPNAGRLVGCSRCFASGAAQRGPMRFRICRCWVRKESPRHPSHPTSYGRLTGSNPTALQPFNTPPVKGRKSTLQPQSPHSLFEIQDT
jgi:hypothetical protein